MGSQQDGVTQGHPGSWSLEVIHRIGSNGVTVWGHLRSHRDGVTQGHPGPGSLQVTHSMGSLKDIGRSLEVTQGQGHVRSFTMWGHRRSNEDGVTRGHPGIGSPEVTHRTGSPKDGVTWGHRWTGSPEVTQSVGSPEVTQGRGHPRSPPLGPEGRGPTELC